MNSRKIEIYVGLFVVLALFAFLLLAFKVVNQGIQGTGETYKLHARFDNIGGLKARSVVKVGGVVIGRVDNISLDPENFTPVVTLSISTDFAGFPETSSVSIKTSGLLGEQYVDFQPGPSYDEESGTLENNDDIEYTTSALVLEDIVSQFLFSGHNE